MKKLTDLLAILGLLLFVCICIPELSNAQKLKPKVLDVNKPSISKSVVKKPGLSSSLKAKLPALEVSRLALNSGCKITGFLQNKGIKIDAGHPDFSKIEIKVGYTFDGKTEEVLLKTGPGSNKGQPRLLISAPDRDNFFRGRPAKFTSNLRVPGTGKGFATVFAEIDPANKIRETPSGERKKRIQKRLRSRCAPGLSPAVKVNVPSKKAQKLKIDPGIKKKAGRSFLPAIHSDNRVTKGGGGSLNEIQFLLPTRMQVIVITREDPIIPVEFEYLHQPGDQAVLIKYDLLAYDEGGRLVKHIYSPERWQRSGSIVTQGGSFGISLSGIPGFDLCYNTYRINIHCHSNIGIVVEGTSAPFIIDYRRTIPGGDGGGTNPSARSNGLQITVPGVERGFCTYADEIGFHYICDIDDLPEGSRAEFWMAPVTGRDPYTRGSSIQLSVMEGDGKINLRVYGWEDLGPGLYKIYGIVRDGSHVLVPESTSEVFELKICPEIIGGHGGGEPNVDPAPVSNGLLITAPAEGYARTHNNIIIRYETDTSGFPTGATIDFKLKKASPPFAEVARLEGQPADGSSEMIIHPIIPGRYRIEGILKDRYGNILGTGSSGIFRLESRGYSFYGGINIISPRASDWYRPSGPPIIVSYDLGSCEEALAYGVIINLLKYPGRILYELYRGIPEQVSNTMSFSIPSGSLGVDSTGNSTSWQIEIVVDKGGRTPDDCYGTSDSFRISF